MVWLFTNPFSKQGLPYYISHWYCTPFFTQAWTLFVPVPEYNLMLFVEYRSKGVICREEIFKKLVIKHRYNRLAGNESLIIAFNNSIHHFIYGTKENRQLNGPVTDDLNWDILQHSAEQYIREQCKCRPDSFQMRLLVMPLNGRSRVYYSN